MNSELVGEPGVSAFLRSVRRQLGGHISRVELFSLSYYDPKQDLKKLKGILTSFQDLLIDGEARRQLGEESVEEWMDELDDLLYDVEPILDDLQSLTNDQVHAHPLFINSNELKNRLGKILDRTEELRVRSNDLKLKRDSGYASSGESKVTMRITRETSSVVDISEIYGREKDRSGIVSRLLEVNTKRKKKYDVVGIWGMGGLGKTTVAQLVYNDPEVVKHFEVRSWVCISDVFDVSKAIKGLIGDGSAGDAQSLQILHQRLQNLIQNKRFLFVLDDVWPSTEWNEKWNMIKTPFNSCQNGSKILVTTRYCNIPQALGDEKPYQLEGLPHEQCMLLFEDNADVNDGEKEKLMKWGEKIVRACKGLPLALKVIGSMLQTAKEEKWRAVSENTELWDTSNIKDGIHPAIRLSYHYLPASLKRCFEYLAVFPPDYKLCRDEVVRLWIADGLVEEVEGRRLEDTGNEYFNKLEVRSLIQKSFFEGNTMHFGDYKMHDIIQHLATVVSRKYCYKENSKEPCTSVRHALLVNRNSMHCEFRAQDSYLHTLIDERPRQDENALRNTIRSCKILRMLIIVSNQNYSLGESSICHLMHLRYLRIDVLNSIHLLDSVCMLDNLKFLFLYEMHLKQLPVNIGNLRSLRALHLGGSSISSLPESICSLCELQVLDLYHCNELKELPKDIGNLRSLRTLDLRGTSILSVPESILNVNGLQNLFVSKSIQLPLHIGRLEGLLSLPFYHVEKEEGQRLGELSLMNRLMGKLTIGSMENIGGVEEAEMADLKSKKNLTHLKFHWSEPGNDEEMEVKIMEALEPHHALESLTFSNYGGNKFPCWMMAGNICWSNLRWLKMEGLNKICEMIDMEFVSLEVLKIENCPKLRKILMATPKLSKLCMKNCGELEADCVHLLPSLSDEVGLLSIVSRLQKLKCQYKIFEYFFEKLKTQNSKWEKLEEIELNAGGRRVASLPGGWPSMMDCIDKIKIGGVGPGKFQFLPDGDQSPFPPSLSRFKINNRKIYNKSHPHHCFTITSDGEVDGEVEWEEESE